MGHGGRSFAPRQVRWTLTSYRREMYRRMTVGPEMPGMDPQLTIREVRRQAERALPGVSVKRLPLPRYELRWRKPEQ